MLREADRLVVAGFVGALRQAGLGVGSCYVYKSVVVTWLQAGGHPGHVDRQVLGAWLGKRRATCSPHTVNNDLKVLRRFYTHQAMCGHCAIDAAQQIPKSRKVPRRMARTLTIEQVADVLTAPDPTTWLGFRDTVLLRVLADTGLHTSQVARLTCGSVLDDATLYIGRDHHREHRYIPISAELHALLNRYIERRREVRPGKRAALFLTCRGTALKPRTMCQLTSRHIHHAIGKALGSCMRAVTGRPWQGHYPHQLRASLAQHYLERGLDVLRVAQLLGYSNAASAAHYVGTDLHAMRAAVAVHPRHRRGSLPK